MASLARKVLLQDAGFGLGDRPAELQGRSIGEALLAVHRSYLRCCLPLAQRGLLSAMAHITGGGLPDNLPRVLPAGLGGRVRTSAIPPLPIADLIVQRGGVDRAEAYRVLNMGVGMGWSSANRRASGGDRLGELGEPFAPGEIVASGRRVAGLSLLMRASVACCRRPRWCWARRWDRWWRRTTLCASTPRWRRCNRRPTRRRGSRRRRPPCSCSCGCRRPPRRRGWRPPQWRRSSPATIGRPCGWRPRRAGPARSIQRWCRRTC
jgi:hypothetical protein